MPSDNHINTTGRNGGGESHPPPPKPNPKLLSMFLKAIIMTVITSLFFLFLGVAAIILLNLCLAGGALRRRLRTHQTYSSNGLSQQDVKKLPQFRSLEWDPEKECVVCLERIGQGQWCRKLTGCSHVFHRRCLDMWLVKVAACPICRARVGLESCSSGTVAYDRMQLWAVSRNSELRVG